MRMKVIWLHLLRAWSRHQLQQPVLNKAHPPQVVLCHHGASVVSALSCHKTSKMRAVSSKDVLQHTLDSRSYALIQMSSNLRFVTGETSEVTKRTIVPDLLERLLTGSMFLTDMATWGRGTGKVAPPLL